MLVRNKNCLCDGGYFCISGIPNHFLGISADLDAQFPDSWHIPLPNGLGGRQSLGTKSKNHIAAGSFQRMPVRSGEDMEP